MARLVNFLARKRQAVPGAQRQRRMISLISDGVISWIKSLSASVSNRPYVVFFKFWGELLFAAIAVTQ